jgi:secondary thiamine-phosphate synthase enzyme
MDTLTVVPAAHAARIAIHTTSATQFIDLTARVEALVSASGITTGLVAVQSMHTTTGVIVNEDEPLLLDDFVALLETLVSARQRYRHDDMTQRGNVPADEPANGHAHCRALLLPTSTVVTISDGHLVLGRWQRIFLVELDGPRHRHLSVVAYGEARA